MSRIYRPDLKDRLKQAFDAGQNKRIMERLRGPAEFAEAGRIAAKAEHLRTRATEEYRARYESRVKHTMAKVREEWTQPQHRHVPRFGGIDRLDANDLRVEAERQVRQRQAQRLARITAGEQRQLNRLAGLKDDAKPTRIQRIAPHFAAASAPPKPPSPLRRAYERSR